MNSLHQHLKDYENPELTFDKNFNDRINKWFDHVSAWLSNERKHKILYIRYEDLQENIRREIERILEFCRLEADKKAIDRAIKRSSFTFMKKYENKFGEQPYRKKVYDQFIRRGKTGEGKSSCSKEQIKEYKKLFREYFQNSDVMKFYK